MARGNKGYIKLYRDIQECWIWQGERFTRGQAWVDLLLMANHKDTKIPFGEKLETVSRGQLITSINKLANKWGWSFNTAKKFLNLLENDNMLTRKSDNSKTLITIVNYGIFQSNESENEEHFDRPIDRPTDEQGMNPLTPNNNDKNDKEYIYIRKFEQAWKHYPRKEDKKLAYRYYKARLNDGYSEDELLQATIGYEEECKKENREKKYIKKGSTFYGVNTPFVDYLPKEKPNIEPNHKIFDSQEQYIPPYFGFPKEWFDGNKLIHERVTPIVRPVDYKYGWYEEKKMQPKDLIEDYELRRAYYEQNNNTG